MIRIILRFDALIYDKNECNGSIPVQPYVQSDAVFGALIGYLNSTLLDTDDGLVVLSAISRKVLGIF